MKKIFALVFTFLILLSTNLFARSIDDAQNLLNEGLELKSKGDCRGALEKYEEALAICKELNNEKAIAVVFFNMGLVYSDTGDYHKGLEYYTKALELDIKIGNTKGESANLNSIGLVYYYLGDYQKGLEYDTKALEIKRKIGDENGEGVALTNIGMVYNALGDYEKALDNYTEALDIFRRVSNLQGESANLNNIGKVYFDLEEYGEALDYYTRALTISRKINNLQGEGNNFNNLGNVYNKIGDYPKSLDYYTKGLEIYKKIKYVKGEGDTLNNMGVVYFNWGDYPKSLDYYTKALKIRKEIGDVNGEALTVMNFGNVYYYLGDYQKGLDYYTECLEIYRKIGDVKGEGDTLNNIGLVYSDSGDYQKALDYYQKALEINKKIGVSYDSIEANMGDVYLSMGKLNAAYEIYDRLNHSIKLGRYYLITKDYGEAKKQFTSTLLEVENQRKAEHLLATYIGLGLSQEGLKNYEEAEKYYKKAVDFIEHQRDSLAKEQRKNFFESKVMGFSKLEPYEGLSRILHYLNRDSDSLYYSESTKARLLAEEIAQKYSGTTFNLPQEVLKKERDIINSIAFIYKQMDMAYKKNNQEKLKELEKKLEPLKAEKDTFITELRKDFPEYASIMYPTPFKLEEIKLRPDEVLIEYEVTDTETLAYLIKDGKIVKTITIPVTEENLSKMIKDYRGSFDAIADPSDLANIKLDTGKKLYDLLLKDLVTGLKSEHIIIIPGGDLGILPFEVLVSELPAGVKMTQGTYGPYPEGVKYAGDIFPISYYQSASALAMIRNLNKISSNRGIFAAGDPVFSSSDERLTGETGQQELNNFTIALQSAVVSGGFIKFIRLPMTGELMEGLKSIFAGDIKILTGLDATKKNIKSQNLKDYRYLVFATHGILDNDVPYIQEPALALCQVNNEEEDGFLTMSEVMGMKFSADVSVLSACKTGLGRAVSGEGVMGMGRAFQYAGAKNVLMSLWSVESKSTNTMVEKYFEYLKQGKTNMEAIREARAYIRREGYEHPFFWGPFIMVGE